jgi:hypothetical protein
LSLRSWALCLAAGLKTLTTPLQPVFLVFVLTWFGMKLIISITHLNCHVSASAHIYLTVWGRLERLEPSAKPGSMSDRVKNRHGCYLSDCHAAWIDRDQVRMKKAPMEPFDRFRGENPLSGSGRDQCFSSSLRSVPNQAA